MTRRRLKVLAAYSMSSTFTTTTLEYLTALQRYTDFDVSYVHATHDAQMDFDFGEFDVVFQNYCVRLCFEGYASSSYQHALRTFRGLKVLAVQDDYDRTSTLHQAIRDLGFHVLLTCIQRDFWPLVYPASEFPGIHVVQGLTGYMPETLTEFGRRTAPLSERQIVVGYRGRDIGAKYGRLGIEKYEIGRRMIEVCTARGISHDIAMDEASRIYGNGWYEFLGRCRVVLGSESGSNVFDFDGSIERRHNELKEQLGRAPTYDEFRPYIEHVERRFNVGQISPRVFECAVMRTPMVLFRGRYSDVIEPDVHYIALEKDFSNIDEVLRRIDNIPGLEAMAERAYERLVSSGLYGYRAFAAKMKSEIEAQYELLVARGAPNIRPAVEAAAGSAGADFGKPTIRSNALAERPTARPKSLEDFQRKQVRFVLEYYVEKFPELQSFYSKTVVACTEEASRLAAEFRAAAELRARGNGTLVELPDPNALTDLMLRRAQIEVELTAVTSQVEALRKQRQTARLTGDDVAVEATLDRELVVLKQYFERGPQLMQQFDQLYQRTRADLIEGGGALLSAALRNTSNDYKGRAKAMIRRIPGIQPVLRLRRRILRSRR